MKRIYLDHNGATFPSKDVIDAYQYALREVWANPSSNHFEGQAAKALLADSRYKIAHCFGVEPAAVTFFSTATEALYTYIHGLLCKGPFFEIITSDLEHNAVYETCQSIKKEKQSAVIFAHPGKEGAVSKKILESLRSEKTVGIVLMSVNNETGVVTDIESIAQLADDWGIPLIVDSVAHLGKAPFTFYKGISAACFSSLKIHGGCGVGFSIMDPTTKFKPLFSGGSHEFGRRAGTVNVPAVYACSVAVVAACQHVLENERILLHLQKTFEERIFQQISGVFLNGEGKRVGSTSNLSFESVDGEALLIQLDRRGVSASHGAACSAGAMHASRVLQNMGYSLDRVSSAVRFSFDPSLSDEEVIMAADIVVEAVRGQRF